MASGRRSKALALGEFESNNRRHRTHHGIIDEYRRCILDGGGVRGWSQILLLGRIIRQIKAAESVNAAAEETELYPCEYFVSISRFYHFRNHLA
jgi:hypothetical protein